MSRYIKLYKWEQGPDSSWLCGEEDIPIMDVPAWEHNGWTRDRPAEPPTIEAETPTDGRRRRTQEAAIA